MVKRFAPLILFLGFAAPVAAQEAPPAAPAQSAVTPIPKAVTVRVSLETGAGAIVLELEKERAPITTANFLRYVDQKKFDGATFYRAMKAGSAGLIQGGAKNALPPIAHEPTTVTRLQHVEGTISMARYAPGTATGDFFITVGGMPSLDANPAAPGDNQGFAAFGRVVEGMDVVRKILEAPISPTAGEGVMKGQMLADPVKIVAARRVAPK
ncbi:peptidylprolyl isomerase [Sphingomonas cavernae]|uniref:peptidylprolyl isomerase n=1 Tax=Sphingomonas cavernae TaxID=2320861 RepID=A0A418WLS7_9SPHN|nr:peptidylprolyl isomerase [Sphingomonas cavernae]RJF90849.1 peptidylprolyl isomerase [Sphingomonas cavernae]